jgi:hypothetical protein
VSPHYPISVNERAGSVPPDFEQHCTSLGTFLLAFPLFHPEKSSETEKILHGTRAENADFTGFTSGTHFAIAPGALPA